MYVLLRSDQGYGYVANPGRERSYTNSLIHARKFPTVDEANANKCGNETIIDLRDLLS